MTNFFVISFGATSGAKITPCNLNEYTVQPGKSTAWIFYDSTILSIHSDSDFKQQSS